jgi:UDP-3-O-acyl N-acetylglucosamine deacetylase
LDFSKEFTITESIEFTGIGVHTGKKSRVIISPEQEGKGINFYKDNVKIPLNTKFAVKTPLCTQIKKENITIFTVEHLLSALYGLGISNTTINVIGEEIPILDGSAKIFCEIISKKIKVQNKKKEFLKLKKPIYVRASDKFIIAIPDNNLKISYFVDYHKNPPGFSFNNFNYSFFDFINEIAPARTFGFLEDAEMLYKKGFALGASDENTLIINSTGYSGALRYTNEPSRHKTLDLIGDLAFLGKMLQANIIAYKTGHSEHLQLVGKIEEIS